MSEKDVELYIRTNVVWSKLPENIRVVLGNSQREYDKLVLEYSIKNQLRYKGNIVRYVKKNEEMYYDIVLKYSEAHLMLYPYHLSDIIVRELRMTPFNYYINIMTDLINAEKSYDSLPNFTAADAMRLLGIGRNQYIELMNQSRCGRRVFRRVRSLKELLPAKPITINIEPWWILCPGGILDSDVKLLSKDEKDTLDILLDEGPQLVGTLDSNLVQTLYSRGLAYFNVPVSDNDYIFVPTLDGFVMNRVTGDYFENLLYQIFVAIDEQTTVRELSYMLNIDLELVKNAVSVFCRLGFAKKRVTGLENLALHITWASHMVLPEVELDDGSSLTITTELSNLSTSFVHCGAEDEDENDCITSENNFLCEQTNSKTTLVITSPPSSCVDGLKRIAFIFDSTLTAFLMMGNLSSSLKNHAVTLFEVGKLSDESLDNFIDELQNVNHFVEGEAQKYSQHARTLFLTIRSLREKHELDLIRGESLLSLDHATRVRLINKTYQFLVSMAPIQSEACPFSNVAIAHFGPAVPEMTSCWFRLYLYTILGEGPISLYIPRGTRIRELPRAFKYSSYLLLTTPTHDPIVASVDNCLTLLNDSLQTHAVLLQEYSSVIDDSEIVNIPFPFSNSTELNEDDFAKHPSVRLLKEKITLNVQCGYVVLLKRNYKNRVNKALNGNSSFSKDSRKISGNRHSLASDESFSDFVLFDCIFGLPLFDEQLNRTICSRINEAMLFDLNNMSNVQFANHHIVESVREMIITHQNWEDGQPVFIKDDCPCWHPPTQILLFDGQKLAPFSLTN